jgi:hypothetical protein
MRRALFAALLLVAGCTGSTVLHVSITEQSGAPPPAYLTMTVFDAHGRVIDGANLGDHPAIPGDVTVLVNPGPIRAFLNGHSDDGRQLWAANTISLSTGDNAAMGMVLVMGAAPDQDGDGVPDPIDNCPTVPNPDQASESGSTQGDACRPAGGGNGGGPVDLGGGGGGGGGGMDMFIPPAKCGDGVVDPGEQCDDGAKNSDNATDSLARCTTGCVKRAGCGPLMGAEAATIDPTTGHCYVSWPGLLNWAAAERECQRNGGDLVSISSQGEHDLVHNLAGVLEHHWIGVTTPPGTPAFANVDGSPLPKNVMWAPTEPNGGDCASMAADGWHSQNCGMASNGQLPANNNNALPYICESACGNGTVDPGETCDPPGPACSKTCQTLAACTEPGAQQVPENGHCYFVTAATFTYANALASGCPTGTHLATLNFPVETEAALKVTGAADSWIAMSAMQTLAVFKWDVAGAIFDATRYHAFGGNDPNQNPPACVAVTNNPPSGQPGWRDRDCASTTIYPAICERDK